MFVNRTRYKDKPTIYGMPPKPPTANQILWANVQALMIRDYGKENLTRLARETTIGPASATRIKNMETSVGIDVLARIAANFKLQPWHLLLPGLDPENVPVAFLTEKEKILHEKLKKAHAILTG